MNHPIQAASVSPARLQEVPLRSGGTSEPRLVKRGETFIPDPHVLPIVAHIDWLSFTVRAASQRSVQDMLVVLEQLFHVPLVECLGAGTGWRGYKHRVNLGNRGLLAYGGKNQRNTIYVSLNGFACAHVTDWTSIQAWGETSGARITRIDLAHDDLDGAQVNIAQALHWFRDGTFSANGRPAKPNLRDDLGTGEGRTFYLGKRESGKLLRIYEKGRQLGDSNSPWCRAEVELHNKGRVIPWQVVTTPGNYLAGAYPCLAFLSTVQCKIKTSREVHRLTFEGMKQWVRTAAGPSIRMICEAEGGDATETLVQVMREGKPKRFASIPARIGDVDISTP